MCIQASSREIHDAYSNLARLLHPDQRNKKQNPQEDSEIIDQISQSNALSDFTELNNANAVLSDEYRRMMYDTINGVREYSATEVFIDHC